MARKRRELTMESNLEYITKRIQDKPKKVMGTVGQQLVREIKSTTLRSQFHTRRKMLHKTLQWAYGWDAGAGRKDITSVQIGFKMSIPGIVGKMITRQEQDPIKPVVVKNADRIQKMVGEALDEIRKE